MKKLSHYQISTLGLLGFTILIIFSGLYSELFRPRVSKKLNKSQLLVNPIRKDILHELDEIKFTNFNNTFTLKRNETTWSLVSPVKMKASAQNIEKILNSLRDIEVKTLFKKDKVNIQNFSLNNPLMNIELKSKLNEVQKIDFGLINSIDDSSYLVVNNMNAIYQTNIISSDLVKLRLSDFIDTTIFPNNTIEVQKFEIISPRENRTLHILENVDENWISSKYNTISNSSTQRKLRRILGINAKVIVDNVDEKTQNFISNYLKNPRYKINIKMKSSDKIKSYLISYLVTSNETLRIERNNNFIIKDLNEDILYLVDKEYFNTFSIRYADLR